MVIVPEFLLLRSLNLHLPLPFKFQSSFLGGVFSLNIQRDPGFVCPAVKVFEEIFGGPKSWMSNIWSFFFSSFLIISSRLASEFTETLSV